jgi:hypothetical protein
MKYFGARTGGIVEIAEGAPGAELFETHDWGGLTEAIARWIEQGCPTPTGGAERMWHRFNPELFVQKHLQIYREVLSSRKPG